MVWLARSTTLRLSTTKVSRELQHCISTRQANNEHQVPLTFLSSVYSFEHRNADGGSEIWQSQPSLRTTVLRHDGAPFGCLSARGLWVPDFTELPSVTFVTMLSLFRKPS